MLDSEGKTHDRLRRLVLREFSPAAIARLKAAMQAHVDRLMDMALERRELDFVEDFAAAIPGAAIGRMLGAGDGDAPLLRRWSEDIVQFFDPDRTAEKKARAEAATGAFHLYLQDLAAARRARPRDDILSRLVAAQDAGQLDGDEVIALAMLILMAGHGSSLDVMGSGLNALLAFPKCSALNRRCPSFIAMSHSRSCWAAASSRPARRSGCCMARPTATVTPLPIPTGSISAVFQTGT
jgi:cytochrome P450